MRNIYATISFSKRLGGEFNRQAGGIVLYPPPVVAKAYHFNLIPFFDAVKTKLLKPAGIGYECFDDIQPITAVSYLSLG
jgi:hypothetical protein